MAPGVTGATVTNPPLGELYSERKKDSPAPTARRRDFKMPPAARVLRSIPPLMRLIAPPSQTSPSPCERGQVASPKSGFPSSRISMDAIYAISHALRDPLPEINPNRQRSSKRLYHSEPVSGSHHPSPPASEGPVYPRSANWESTLSSSSFSPDQPRSSTAMSQSMSNRR